MPDITMCLNTGCKLAKKCKRSPMSGTKTGYNQSVAYFKQTDKECEYFMEKEK